MANLVMPVINCRVPGCRAARDDVSKLIRATSAARFAWIQSGFRIAVVYLSVLVCLRVAECRQTSAVTTMNRRSLFRNMAAASAGLALAPRLVDWDAPAAASTAASSSSSAYPLLPFIDYYQTNISTNLSFATNAAAGNPVRLLEAVADGYGVGQRGSCWTPRRCTRTCCTRSG
jgi:hypothetical protein